MNELLPHAQRAIELLKARGHTIAVAESSCGGLITAALLAVPGASACVRGGLVIYTYQMRREFLGLADKDVRDITPSTEEYALRKARRLRERSATHWTLSETGAAGPTGSRYGFPPGHACFAVIGPAGERSRTLETGSPDRVANMHAFAAAAIGLLCEAVEAVPK